MKKLIVCLAAVLVSIGAMAETKSLATTDTKPFNLSITPDIAIYGRNVMIEGLTLSIWGENQQTSLALGIVNGTTGNSAGLDWGCVNYAENYKGVKWSFVNYTKQNTLGWDAGFVNYTGGTMRGLYTGAVNYVDHLKGLEFGFINYVDNSDTGFQIGIINIIHNNKSWFSDLPNSLAPVMIFVNWRF